jgi:hypothetical protein
VRLFTKNDQVSLHTVLPFFQEFVITVTLQVVESVSNVTQHVRYSVIFHGLYVRFVVVGT